CSVRLSPSAPTAIYTLSLHDALPILDPGQVARAHPALPPLHQVVGSDHPGVPQPQELLLAPDGELLPAARLLDLQLHAAVRLGTTWRCCNPRRRGAVRSGLRVLHAKSSQKRLAGFAPRRAIRRRASCKWRNLLYIAFRQSG